MDPSTSEEAQMTTLADESAETLRGYYTQMVLVRAFEQRSAEMYQRAKIGGYCHLNLGEEATVVGLMAALQTRDYLFIYPEMPSGGGSFPEITFKWYVFRMLYTMPSGGGIPMTATEGCRKKLQDMAESTALLGFGTAEFGPGNDRSSFRRHSRRRTTPARCTQSCWSRTSRILRSDLCR